MLASRTCRAYTQTMNVTSAPEQTFPVDVDLAGSVTEALSGQVQRWSRECQRFLDWQRQFFVTAEDSNALRPRRERALQRLLGLGRMLNSATSDPEFMDRRAADLVKARLAQLQESWELTHAAMTGAEAEAVLAAHFRS
jgi:hypothetical protein